MTKSVVLADPRGFCAGVDRAILTVQTILKAAEASGKRTREDGLPPVYVRRQIVHNKHVVEDWPGKARCSSRNWRRFRMLLPKRVFRWCFPPMAYLR